MAWITIDFIGSFIYYANFLTCKKVFVSCFVNNRFKRKNFGLKTVLKAWRKLGRFFVFIIYWIRHHCCKVLMFIHWGSYRFDEYYLWIFLPFCNFHLVKNYVWCSIWINRLQHIKIKISNEQILLSTFKLEKGVVYCVIHKNSIKGMFR